MNIFVTSECPIESARFLDDKRVIKMVLESTQLLCTALNVNGLQSPYKTAHKNHPCSIWARHTRANWLWLLKHAYALADEYTARYNKIHACVKVLDKIAKRQYYIPDGPLTEFSNCAGNKALEINYTDMKDVIIAYQLYLDDRWNSDKREPTWYGV